MVNNVNYRLYTIEIRNNGLDLTEGLRESGENRNQSKFTVGGVEELEIVEKIYKNPSEEGGNFCFDI